jgi:alkylation response protein AidB-like acyl-CoA dehydrogenase
MLTYRAAWELAAPDPGFFPEMNKLYTSEAAVDTFTAAGQIYGALGYTSGGRVERNLRDALGMTISSGTSDLQRTIVAGRLGLAWPERR